MLRLISCCRYNACSVDWLGGGVSYVYSEIYKSVMSRCLVCLYHMTHCRFCVSRRILCINVYQSGFSVSLSIVWVCLLGYVSCIVHGTEDFVCHYALYVAVCHSMPCVFCVFLCILIVTAWLVSHCVLFSFITFFSTCFCLWSNMYNRVILQYCLHLFILYITVCACFLYVSASIHFKMCLLRYWLVCERIVWYIFFYNNTLSVTLPRMWSSVSHITRTNIKPNSYYKIIT